MFNIIFVTILIILFLTILSSIFIVNEIQNVIVIQLGAPKRIITKPGLYLKIPFIQKVVYFDNRIFNLNIQSQEVITSDRKRIIVDLNTKYKIVDPLLFYQTVNNINTGNAKLNSIMNSEIRNFIGRHTMQEILSKNNFFLENDGNLNDKTLTLGIKIVDLTIKRIKFPNEVNQSIYNRMQAEREIESAKLRAEGEEIAYRIKAEGERTVRHILIEGNKEQIKNYFEDSDIIPTHKKYSKLKYKYDCNIFNDLYKL
ncbi:SPFH domain / Band 7 family [seawater metagenome]|uniref:SPFH domain / Band 7 family n=1 Tax=seawater metagenome TaxID=1561972 RepID=A0A5E8CH94_9ZZZZ